MNAATGTEATRSSRPRRGPFGGTGWAVCAGLLTLTAAATLHAQNAAQPDPAAAQNARLPAEPPAEPVEKAAAVSAVPKQMTLTKPLATEAELEQQLNDLNRANVKGLLRDGLWNEAARQWVPKYAKFRTELMTLDKMSNPRLLRELGLSREKIEELAGEPVEVRPYLHVLRDETLSDISNAGMAQTNAGDYLTFRTNLCAAMVSACERLMGNNFYVRVNAVILMAQLNESENYHKVKLPKKPYTGSAEPLLNAINDPQQLVALKIPAVVGLERILLQNPPRDPDLKHRIARGLIAELEKPGTFFWYQIRLGEMLAALDLSVVNVPNQPARPLIVQTLMKVMVDETRHPCVRARMAHSLGRVPIDASVDVDLLAYELTHLAHQFASAYNSDIDKPPVEYYWPECLFKVFLAFRPWNEDPDEKFYNKPGLLSRYATGVLKEAYDVILPMVNHMIQQDLQKPQPMPKDLLQATSTWLQEHTPTNYRVFPDGEPLRPVMAARPQGGVGPVAEK